VARAVDAVALKSRCAAVSDTYANQVLNISLYYVHKDMCNSLARVEYTLARAVDAVALKSRCAAVSDTYANQVLNI